MSRPLVVRAVSILGVIAGAGCAQIAGIDETSGNGRPVDSLAVTRLSVGATVESNPQDLTGLTATYFVKRADGSGFDGVPAAVSSDPGKWTTKLYAPAAVQFTLPDVPTPIRRLFAFPSLGVQLAYGVLEHPNPSPAPDGATLSAMLQLDSDYTAADRFTAYCVGAWTSRAFAPTDIIQVPGVNVRMLGPVNYAYSSSVSATGRPQLDRITARDAFLVLRYVNGALVGVAEATPFDQTGTDAVTVAFAAVPQDQVLDVKITSATLTTRYNAVRPAVSGLSMSWGLVAAPGYKYGINAGPSLYSGTLPDVGVMAKYGNPFVARGWNTMFVVSTSASRAYAPAGVTMPLALSAGMSQSLEAPPPGFELTLPAGLPILITLDRTPLSTDGQPYKAPTQFAHVTLVVDAPGGAMSAPPTLYNLYIYDLVLNAAGTGLDRQLVLAAASRDPSFDVPPDVFVAGPSYTMRAFSTLGGYLGADSGDLLNSQLPIAQSYLDSAVFTVTP
jgi:hypothetical protein